VLLVPAPTRLLVNPAAGRGRALRRLDGATRALSRVGPLDVVRTAERGDEARLALEAAADGVRTLAVLGGDGTVSQVAGALATAGADTSLAILAAGTGNDFAKSLGAPVHDYAAMAERIARGRTRRVDVGRLGGRPFVNAAGFGFDVAVLERMTRARWLRGDALYLAAALAELFRFGGVDARVRVAADVLDQRARWLLVVLANGQWFGGSFRIAPSAQLDDGRLDLVLVRDTSAWRRARLFAAAPFGAHVRAPEVQTHSGDAFTVTPDRPAAAELDGELVALGASSCDVDVLRGALSCLV
jgi:diacylglycerol kinase (ATP)